MTKTEVQSQPEATPTTPATPAAPTVPTATPAKKGMSTGAKVALGLCGGCLGLIILLGIISTIAGGFMLRSMPNFIQDALEKEGINVDQKNGNVTITDKDSNSNLSAGESLELPSNFPSDIPTYSSAKVTFKYTQNKDGSVIFSTSDNVTKVKSYYTSEMKKKGWTGKDTLDINDISYNTYTKGNYSTTISVGKQTDDESKTSISITYTYTEPTE